MTALIDAPEAVEALLEKIMALQFAFLDEWFRLYGSAFVAHYPDYYLSGGSVSPGMRSKRPAQ